MVARMVWTCSDPAAPEPATQKPCRPPAGVRDQQMRDVGFAEIDPDSGSSAKKTGPEPVKVGNFAGYKFEMIEGATQQPMNVTYWLAGERGPQVTRASQEPSSLLWILDAALRAWLLLLFAEREGFEPSVRLPVHMISSHAPSTTRSSLLGQPAPGNEACVRSGGGRNARRVIVPACRLRRERDSNPRYPYGHT